MENDIATKEYELAYFVTTPEAEAELLMALEKCGIKVSSKIELAPRTLAYPIAKQTTALFGCAALVSSPEAIRAFGGAVRHLSGLLRHLVVRRPALRTAEARRPMGEPPARPAPAAAREPSWTETPVLPNAEAGAALSNEALEEKLKEML